MDELIAFVRAALDEDERVARALEPVFGIYPDGHTSAGSEFLDRFDADRVLAEVEAKRRILDALQGQREEDDPFVPLAGDVIPKALAKPYAGREGWREEWSA